ncbi:MAG: S-layer homology domain-containing protein [Clostridiaceae bacterium]|nr:S-layer homology domain-containing protein [Clostridiaceae bacterium]
MKLMKKALAFILAFAVLTAGMPLEAFAQGETQAAVSIDNGYIRYSINKKTGGFSIATLAGHPQKSFDNNIPLLFKEDVNSTETSFTTVRIDGKDYVFGQDYGLFGMASKLYDPVVNSKEKTIITKWEIKDIEVTQKVAISGDLNNDLAGNAGIAYEIKNKGASAKKVGIRTLLDTALGDLDAPYFMAGFETTPTVTEKEFKGSELPDQIRGVDSVAQPKVMSYAILKGWSAGAAPDRVIAGHWCSLANTRYDYTPNKSLDFSNYSSTYRTPDSALAFYWSEKSLEPDALRKSEFLYGIGNFSSELADTNVNINLDVDRVYAEEDGKGYKNNGIFEVRVEIDNTVNNARDIASGVLRLSLDKGLSIVEDTIKGDNDLITKNLLAIEKIPAGTIYRKYWRVKAETQTTVTAKRISASLSTAATNPAEAGRHVILPSVAGNLPHLSFDTVTPGKFYKLGYKNINVTGDLEAFKALGGKAGWNLYLRHVATGELVDIKKEDIAFTGDRLDTLSFNTEEELTIGEYEIVFNFTDEQLIKEFTKEIVIKQRIEVNLDESLQNRAYAIMTVLRYNTDQYKFVSFRNEQELEKYKKNNRLDSYECNASEMLLEVRGTVKEYRSKQPNGSTRVYYAADPGTSDVTINNVVRYNGREPLMLEEKNGAVLVSGNGKISVVDNLTFWNSGFEIKFQQGKLHSLASGKVDIHGAEVKNVLIQYTGIGALIQNIGGITIDLKYGVLTENWDKAKSKKEGFGINFGGKMALTFFGGGEKKKTGNNGTGTGNNEDGNLASDEFEKGTVTADIQNVLFGENSDKVDFLGINATAKLTLPSDAFGSFIKNPPGVYAELVINTLDNIYSVDAGVKIYAIECTGELRLKITEIEGVKVPIPDKLHFKLYSNTGSPVVPPFLSIISLGGGYDNLADTLSGGYIGTLPPLELNLLAGIRVIETFDGEQNLTLGLRGMSLEGILSIRDIPNLTWKQGISARWEEPFHLSMHGDLNVFDVIKGGVSVTIARDYFYGYGYLRVIIPRKIPLIGGMTLAQIEAGISNTMIGMNIKIIGIKYGVVYYWGSGKVNVGGSVDIEPPKKTMGAMHVESTPFGSKTEASTAMYGTNIRRLTSSTAEAPKPMLRTMTAATAAVSGTAASSVSKAVNVAGSDALLFEISYTGAAIATTEVIRLINPDGRSMALKLDNSLSGGEEGNFMVQDMGEDGKYAYITVTEAADIVDGTWRVESTDPMVAISNFEVNAVDNIPELRTFSISRGADNSSLSMGAAWSFDTEGSKLDNSKVDIYLTENKNAVEEARINGITDTSALGEYIGRFPAKDKSEVLTIPDTLQSGTYYAIAVLAHDDCGPSIMTSPTPVIFENRELPVPVQGVKVEYGGDGMIKVEIEDAASKDYTHYNIFTADEHGSIIDGAMGYFAAGSGIRVGGSGILQAGQSYKIIVQTVKEKNGKSYTGGNEVTSKAFVMPEIKRPVLVKMDSNINSGIRNISENKVSLKYTFDQEVNLKVLVNGVDNMKSDAYKKVWEFEKELSDGDYVINIEAGNKAEDSYIPPVDGAVNPVLAFTVDTTIPVLRLGSYVAASLDQASEAAMSKQTVRLKNGVLDFDGMTEAGCTILIDGSSQGITVESSGAFTVKREVDLGGSVRKDMLLTVTDKAGNQISTAIYALAGDISAPEALNINLVGDDGKLKAIESADGYKRLEVKTKETKRFAAVNTYKMKDGSSKDYVVLPEQLNWSVMYGSNLIDFEEGVIYAKEPGEVLLKAGTLSAGFKQSEDSEEQSTGTEDMVILNIEEGQAPPAPNPGGGSDKDSGNRREITPAGGTLQALLDKLISQIGAANVMKSIELQGSRQESIAINDRLGIIVPIFSVDKNDILLLYKPADAGKLKDKAPGRILGDIMTMATATGRELKKQVILVYDYNKDEVTDADKVGLYKYNKLFGKWEYLMGENDTRAGKLTVNAEELGGSYAFIENPNFREMADISEHWAGKYIYRLASLSIVDGIKEGERLKFYPDREISRAEFVKLAVAAMALEPEDYKNVQLSFADAEEIPDWALGYVKAACSKGWIKGKASDGKLMLDISSKISKQEAVTILYRIKAAGKNEGKLSFTDSRQISQYAKEAIEGFSFSGIVTGYGDGSFKPQSSIKRSETVKLLFEWLDKAVGQGS